MPTWLRAAIRSLRKSPSYSFVVVASLSIGIGACVLTFSALDAQWNGADIPDEDRLVRVGESTVERCANGCPEPFDRATLVAWQAARPRSLASLAPYQEWARLELIQPQLPDPVSATIVGADFFPTIGVRPAAGRLIGPDDCSPDAPAVAVVSYGFAREILGGVSHAVKATLRTSERTYSVIGVLPRGFAFPAATRVWTGCTTWTESTEREAQSIYALSRLAPGVSDETARIEMLAVAKVIRGPRTDCYAVRVGQTTTCREEDRGVTVMPYARVLSSETGTGHWALMGAVWLAFIVACANVANLTLIRALRREREVAVRYSLGAKPKQIALLLLAESGLLVVLSTIIGIVGASQALSIVSRAAQAQFGFDTELALNGTVVVATVLLALLVTAACGLAPMAQLGRADAATLLRAGGTGLSQRRGHTRLKSALVGAQVAMVVALGCGALIFARAYEHTSTFKVDFDTDGVLVANLSVNDAAFARVGGPSMAARGLVQQVGDASANPAPAVMTRYWGTAKFRAGQLLEPWITIDGREPIMTAWSANTGVYGATPTLLRVLGVPIIAGRDFTANDMSANANVAIVNEAAATEFWPGADAVGKRFKFGPADSPEPWITVVGVARGATRPDDGSLAMMMPGRGWKMIYRPIVDARTWSMWVVARLDAIHPQYVERTRRAAQSVFGPVTSVRFRTLRAQNEHAMAGAIRLKAQILIGFAIATMFLGLIGIQALVAESVLQRTREIGIRMALGAPSLDVLRTVLQSTMLTAIGGVAAGCAFVAYMVVVAWRLLLGIQSAWTPETLVGQSITDPRSYLVVLAIIAVAVAFAGLIPARRALGVDPVKSLRAE